MNIAILTSEENASLTREDHLLQAALRELGADSAPVIWSRPNLDFADFDAALIRTTWDYHQRLPEFLNVLGKVSSEIPLWNPLELVKWNSSKAYLRELETQGIAVPNSRWFDDGARVDYGKLFTDLASDTIVIKPLVSGGGRRTFCETRASLAKNVNEIQTALNNTKTFVQAYLPEIVDGEYSFIFFNANGDGQFQYAIHKQPKSGDFRVHEHFGATLKVFDAPASWVETARLVTTKIPFDWLYARIDMVPVTHDKLILMELEALEPSLFMQHYPPGAQTFAKAILTKMEK